MDAERGRRAAARRARGSRRRALADGASGQATVGSTALAALIASLLVAVIALIASGGEVKAGRELAGVIGRRIACAPHLPDACHHEAVLPAYGLALAPLARALPPTPGPLPAH